MDVPDDVLVLLQSYLTPHDYVSFAESYPRFWRLMHTRLHYNTHRKRVLDLMKKDGCYEETNDATFYYRFKQYTQKCIHQKITIRCRQYDREDGPAILTRLGFQFWIRRGVLTKVINVQGGSIDNATFQYLQRVLEFYTGELSVWTRYFNYTHDHHLCGAVQPWTSIDRNSIELFNQFKDKIKYELVPMFYDNTKHTEITLTYREKLKMSTEKTHGQTSPLRAMYMIIHRIHRYFMPEPLYKEEYETPLITLLGDRLYIHRGTTIHSIVVDIPYGPDCKLHRPWWLHENYCTL